MKLSPFLKSVIWGGERLRHLGKQVKPGEKIGEAWEISDLPGKSSTIVNGELRGSLLADVVEEFSQAVLGKLSHAGRLPLLIKFIDSHERLSVQVHPDDRMARLLENEPNGKSEVWIILEADPGAEIVFGLKPGTTRETVEKSLAGKSIRDCLNFLPAARGDVFAVKPGTVHALMEGLLLLEIQQASDITYRIYDWDRVEQDGKPRKLHIEQSLMSIDFSRAGGQKSAVVDFAPRQGTKVVPVIKNPEFCVDLLSLSDTEIERETGDRPLFYTVLAGTGTVACNSFIEPVTTGESILIPAMAGTCRFAGADMCLAESR